VVRATLEKVESMDKMDALIAPEEAEDK